MQPVLFNVGPLSISSFGFFLALAFVTAVFLAWRLARAYDLSQEQVLDLSILSFFGGIIGARLYFVIFHWSAFGGDLGKIVLINRYPGLSFWGGLLGGSLIFWLLIKRTKINFWQAADFAAVAFWGGTVFGNIGCFLGGCAFGAVSNLPIATAVVGLIGKRFPVAVVESLLLLLTFGYLWKQVVRFHFAGKILSVSLILLGIVKFMTEFFRGDSQVILSGFSLGYLFSLGLIFCGILVFYGRSKRNLWQDLVSLGEVFYQRKRQARLLSQFNKTLYNYKVGFKVKVERGIARIKLTPKILKRRLNVKSTPTNLR